MPLVTLNVNPFNRNNNKKKKHVKPKVVPFFEYFLSAFQNIYNGDLSYFRRRNFLRLLILRDLSRLIIIHTIFHSVKPLHILETWHSLLYIIP